MRKEEKDQDEENQEGRKRRRKRRRRRGRRGKWRREGKVKEGGLPVAGVRALLLESVGDLGGGLLVAGATNGGGRSGGAGTDTGGLEGEGEIGERRRARGE